MVARRYVNSRPPGSGRGFVQLPRAVLFDNRLSYGARLLYAVLQDHWRQGGECWASLATLAEEMAQADKTLSVRQLQRYLAELVKKGYIEARARGHGQAKAYTPATPSSTTPASPPKRSTNREVEAIEVETTYGSHGASATPATKGSPAKVNFGTLSEGARTVLDDWRRKQGKTRPPKLNPVQAKELEEAVSDLGVDRLFEANTWAAGAGVPELRKAVRAARTKRRNDEAAESRSTNGHTNSVVGADHGSLAAMTTVVRV